MSIYTGPGRVLYTALLHPMRRRDDLGPQPVRGQRWRHSGDGTGAARVHALIDAS